MYPVSELYKQKIKENNRIFECKIQIEHSQGTLEIDDKDLVYGSLTYTEASQAGEEFTIGGTVASDISFTIFNKSEYKDIQFMGATVFVNIGLQIQEGIDAHFLQPSQPSRMPGFEEKWEYVPLGIFHIDDVNRQRNTIQIKAVDNMINLDKPYSLSKLSYPATLYQIYTNICNIADVPVGTTNFPNKDYVVKVRPDGDLTLRDVLGYVAELAGCFAKCNRHGALELRWYEPTDITLGPANRFNFKPSDDLVQIKGIMATIDGTTYLAGSDEYAIDLSENPLLQGDYETVLPNIFNNIKDTVFTPYTSDWQGNPAIQAGDIIKQIDRDGKVYNTLVTKSIYKYRGRSILEARGLPEISRGYKGSTNRKLAEIRRKIDVEVGDKLTDLEQAMLNATELITGQLGGYVLKRENELLIMDNPDPDLAQKIWRWNLSGLGYSSTGIKGPYELAMTMDGAINANFITTGLLSANLVKTGILQSQDGSTYINLDDGSFKFKDALQWINNVLSLNSGIVTIDNKIRVNHGRLDEYSEINSNGFIRKWRYGEGKYLNSAYIFFGPNYGSINYEDPPEPVRVELPPEFAFRNSNNIKTLIAPRQYVWAATIPEWETIWAQGFPWMYGTYANVDTLNLGSTPYADVSCYTFFHIWEGGTQTRAFYRRSSFNLLVLGE